MKFPKIKWSIIPFLGAIIGVLIVDIVSLLLGAKLSLSYLLIKDIPIVLAVGFLINIIVNRVDDEDE